MKSEEEVEWRHRGVSEVPCVSLGLKKLDLSFNKLSTVAALAACSNLKWLSVAHNKVESLEGIDALTNLSVFNASNNSIVSLHQISSLTCLRCLILNHNRIASIPSLHRLSLLNTLVLSKNPISEIGNALAKSTAITKLSLSHCRLRTIGASLKSCAALKELRLAHNAIKALPPELSHNKVLLNLDLGYNAIAFSSDLKVLASLVHLRNLNVQGNPIAAQPKFVKKVKNLLPKLRVFNAKPIEKQTKSQDKDTQTDSSPAADQNFQDGDGIFGAAKDEKKARNEKQRSFEIISSYGDDVSNHQSKQKSEGKNAKVQKRKCLNKTDVEANKSKEKRREVDVIDDGEVPITELISADNMKEPMYEAEMVNTATGIVVSSNSKRKKTKTQTTDWSAVAVGMGGPSTWGDD